MQMSSFFPLLGIHLEILTVASAHPFAFAFLYAATKVDLTPRESGSTLPSSFFSSSTLPLPPLLRQATAWFITALLAASYKCWGTTLLLRLSFIGGTLRFLGIPLTFPRVLKRTSGRISKILRPFVIISKEIHLRITYVKLNISFLEL